MASANTAAAVVNERGVSVDDLESPSQGVNKSFSVSGFPASNYKSEALSHAEAEVLRSSKTIQGLRKREFIWVGIITLLVLAMFCTSLMAIHVMKDMHVENSQLVDAQGAEVFTRNQIDTIEGIRLPEGRRLGDNFTSTGMQISEKMFKRIRRAYIKGEPEWVVSLPEDTARTVTIQGVSKRKAWGLCGDCMGSIVWVTDCEGASSECDISLWRADPKQWLRRLAESEDIEEALMARVRAANTQEGMHMERSLSGKQCA
eukprot:TRINITY_DN75033_c0_g1_i1.p1 TRINITY_DN75033_c0_g1~~TRINITY_DN75033_c0_g1_i1.p1  ORF type:complete len:259 (+),score=49.58 TRINITY_DN75033_c0_g1_i1:76-852(+)